MDRVIQLGLFELAALIRDDTLVSFGVLLKQGATDCKIGGIADNAKRACLAKIGAVIKLCLMASNAVWCSELHVQS